jgi:hypothetical protein
MSSTEQFDHIFATGLAIGAKRDEQFLKQRVRGVVHLLGEELVRMFVGPGKTSRA